MRKSFGEILRESDGIGHGFDFARVVLALSVLGWHEVEVFTGSTDFIEWPGLWMLHRVVLPMFFGLSGFLVAGSAQRLTLINFAINRGFRIVPALAVEILLSAIIIGPCVTSFTLHQYFNDREFWTYLLNIVGVIHFRLPGVFATNPVPFTVNVSLWTVPFEIACYVLIAALIVTGLVFRTSVILLGAGAVALAMVGIEHSTAWITSATYAHIVTMSVRGGFGPPLIPCFLLGIAAYALRNHIIKSNCIALSCVAVLALTSYALPASIWGASFVALASCPLMVYLVCYVGLTSLPRLPYFGTGDYSYGIYLYGYPIQQTVAHLFPTQPFALHAAASLILTIAFATVSWHVIEKPVLRLRKGLSFATRAPSRSSAPQPLSNRKSELPHAGHLYHSGR